MKLKITQTKGLLFKGFLLKTGIIVLIFLWNTNVFSQDATKLPSELTAAYTSTLAPGTTITIADGTYSGSFTMKVNGVGTSTNPITFKAQTPGGVKFTNGQQLKIGGDYCIIDGLWWQGGNGASNFIEFRDGSNYAYYSTLQNCVVDGLQVSGGTPTYNASTGVYASVKHNWVVMYGNYNTVINCSFMNKISSGNFILAEYQFNASADGTGLPNTRCDEVGHKIINNYFYKYAKIDDTYTNSGDSEAIRIGTSEYQNVNSNALVQNNYFVEADGENEIITNKSKGNSYINNTFRRCRGSLVLRHGSDTTVNGNYFLGMNVDGTGGIRIVDSNQIIRNNYIQDCITVIDQAQWNNGITFLGGSAAKAVDCSVTTGLSNGYQKVENLNLSNNTIVNTNAPLFYNIAQGSTDPLGSVNDNLIYFTSGNSNITPVINQDYTALGTALTYSGNVWKGASSLGATNTGFAEVAGITATQSGEIFTFTGADGKGADMGTYTPITDGMVGNEIGACFVNYLGASYSGTCSVVIPETLVVGSLSTFAHTGGSMDVSITANVSWSATSNDSWITTINPSSGTGDATVSVTVTENTGTESRSGSVTFTQTSGDGNGTTKTLNITQDAPPPPDPRDGLNLINPLFADVEAVYACHEETEANGHSGKFNDAWKSLDKNPDTQWAGSAALGECASAGYTSIIYDLKGAFDLDLVDIATTSGKTYNLQIWVSSTVPVSPETYPANGDFTLAYPSSGFFQISTTPTVKVPYTISPAAAGTRYVKIVGDGQPGGSRYTTIHEIEFYGDPVSLSVDDKQITNQVKMYPNPVSNILTVSQIKTQVNVIQVFTLDGRKVMEKPIKSLTSEIKVDVSTLSNGAYILNLVNSDASKDSKMFIVSH
ncbi:poly(beta-D-mannuronate) lyase [Mariniflexile fucanivorans]|uniref:Poly(Beta-D-mannuronate) lyase n=1 Tax=Mariniflexile fucanivorans TaxID=264023 RepID=A0A4R1RKK5_9FLAO|nr:chondroitinase-B domain-containing protein [Mariniflexile fucanivorans]TCL66731.1 poly(beta-D-mannuronate) lyase [Mariniflexile fucanivorans]